MAVPDNYSFSLQDVEQEIPGSQVGLKECFDNAITSGFNPTYQGTKNSLRNFRDYDHTPTSIIRIFDLWFPNSSSASGACTNSTVNADFWHNGPATGGPVIGTTVFNNSSGTQPWNGQNRWHRATRIEGSAIAIRIDNSGVVTGRVVC